MIPRRRRTKSHTMPEISLTPLIDTALVLLVIFMVATPIMKNSLNINLPKGNMKEDKSTSSTAPVVAIDSRGTIRLNDEPMPLDRLVTKIAQLARDSKANKVYVQCDDKASSGILVQVIDTIKYVAGVEDVVLSTERA